MERPVRTVAGIVALALGVTALRRARASRRGEHATHERWLTVTINRSAADVERAGALPPPLDRFGDSLESRVSRAPGDRGTELAVRLKDPGHGRRSLPARLAGKDPRQEVRTALREAKALLEAGEVTRPDTPPTTRGTPAGKLVGVLTRRSSGEGVL